MTSLRNKNIWPTKCSATKKPQCCLHFGQEQWKISNVIWNPLAQVAGAWTERKKMFHGGSFLKLADDDV